MSEAMDVAPYRGRFAPSPSGPLHFGSLIAALGSCLDARSHGGEWLVRMEDIDPPREMPGAADNILHALERFGFEWDGAVMYQSRRGDAYLAALDQLHRDGMLYGCACTRREIADSSVGGVAGPVYPGTCRTGIRAGREARALRVLTDDVPIELDDSVQGRVVQQLESTVGDFVLRRADGLFAYQLAVVVDDAEQGINHVVRGADLLDSTPRQIYLQRRLGFQTPCYAHLPVVVNERGEKLSKQTLAPALDARDALSALVHAATFLGQQPPAELLDGDITAFWQWAKENWRLQAVPKVQSLPMPGYRREGDFAMLIGNSVKE